MHSSLSCGQALCQNVPFVLSITCQVASAVLQGRAEGEFIGADQPKPPPLLPFLQEAASEYRTLRNEYTRSRPRRDSVADGGRRPGSGGRPAAVSILSPPPALSVFVRRKWREWHLLRVEFRRHHSKRYVNALTGIEKHKPPLTEEEVCLADRTGSRGRTRNVTHTWPSFAHCCSGRC